MLSKYNWNLKIGLKKQMGWLLQLSFAWNKRSQAVSGKSFTVTEIKHRSLALKLWTYFHVHELTKKN